VNDLLRGVALAEPFGVGFGFDEDAGIETLDEQRI
jgi:hypothetical protein